MNTGLTCPCCKLPILTNHIIVGLPVIRITGPGTSALTGDEIAMHASCFTEKMAGLKKTILELAKP